MSWSWRYKVTYKVNVRFKSSSWPTDVETTTHYLLPSFFGEILILINKIWNIDNDILNLDNFRFLEVLLFGNSSFDNTKNTSILNTTIKHIVSSKKFYTPLFDSWSVSWTPIFMHGCFVYLLSLFFFVVVLFCFVLFSFFIRLLPIIIDVVFTLFYYVTLEYDF